MKTKNLITAFLLIFAMSFFACDNNKLEEPEINFPRELEFTEFFTERHCYWERDLEFIFADIKTDTLYIVNSYEKLKKHLWCAAETYPEIDFSTHTLLWILSNIRLTDYELLDMNLIQHSEYKYGLAITALYKPYRGIIDFHMLLDEVILVPKISNEASITLNVEYIRKN